MNARKIVHTLRGKKSGNGWIAKCPAHDDNNPSLSVREVDGKVLLHCHAGCEQSAVITALKDLELWPERDERNDIEAIYDYTDARGNLLYQIVRKTGKRFLQRYSGDTGQWVWKKYPNQVLYHLREVLENSIIFLVEGEKDCERLRDHGFVATTAAGGAKAPWLDSYTDSLCGREVILIPDNDAPGRDRVLRIARALKGNVARLVILTLDDPGVKDVSDWFDAGHSELELIAMLDGKEVSR